MLLIIQLAMALLAIQRHPFHTPPVCMQAFVAGSLAPQIFMTMLHLQPRHLLFPVFCNSQSTVQPLHVLHCTLLGSLLALGD